MIKKYILVVDTDKINHQDSEKYLTELGYKVIPFEPGSDNQKEVFLNETATPSALKGNCEHQHLVDLFWGIRTNHILGYLMTTENGIILDVNDTYLHMTGYTREEIVNGSLGDIDNFIEQEKLDFVIQQAESLGSVQFETKHKKKNGFSLDVEINLIYLKDQKTYISFIQDISGKKREQEELAKSRSKLNNIIKSGHVGTWEWNVQTGETVFNERWANIVGYSLEELQPISINTWIKLCHPDDLAASNAFLQKHFDGELDYYDFEARMKHKNGHWVWVHDRGQVASRTPDNKPEWMYGTHTDITERKQASEQIKYQSELRKLLVELSTDFINLPHEKIEDFITYSLEEVGKFVGADRSYLFEYDFDNNTCSNTHEWCAEGISRQIEVSQNLPLSEMREMVEMHKNGKALIIPDVSQLTKNGFQEILQSQEIRSLILVPLIKKEDCIGFVGFDSVKQHNRYTENEQQLLEVFAEVLVNALLRKEVEESLTASEEKYRLLIENQNDLVVKVDANNKFLYVSPSYCNLFARSEDELIGKSFLPLIHPDDREQTERAMNELLREPYTCYVEQRALTADGWRWLAWSDKAVIDDSGSLLYITAVGRDITEQKITEEALIKSEERFRSLYNNSTIGIYRTSPAGEILMVNSKVLQLLEFDSLEDLAESEKIRPARHYVSDKKREEFRKLLEENGVVNGFEAEWRTRTGKIVQIRESAKAVKGANGNIIYYDGTIEDITEMKRALETITKLSMAVQQSPLSIVITNSKANIEYVNPAGERITGYSIEELLGKHTKIFQSGKTNRETYKEMWRTISAGETWSGELLNKKKDGTEYWESIVISPILDEYGNVLNYLAVKEDVTEKKKIEKELADYRTKLEDIVEERTTELKLSEEKYKALTENSEDVIMRFDRDHKHLYVNPAVERVTGKKVEEFIGKSHDEIEFPNYLVEQWDAALKETFINREINRIEFELPNGEWYDWLLIPELDESGEVNTITTSARNISALKEYEAKIKDALEKEKEVNEFKSNFISTASHQFRTPLASVLSSTQMLKRYAQKWDDEKKNEHYRRISDSIKDLTELMDDLLMVSKAEEGKYKIKYEQINIEQQLISFIEEVKNSSDSSAKIDFNNKLTSNNFTTDRNLFQQIVNNLLTNAVKYNRKNKKISVEIRTFEQKLMLSVRDEGIGIPEKEQKNIFESFYRVKNGLELPGTGLGLSIVKRAVDLLNGDIKLESEVGEGATFIITLPIVETAENAA